MNRYHRLGPDAWTLTAVGAMFLVGATVSGAAQAHSGAGGSMGGWGAGGGWLLWSLPVLVLFALAVSWARGQEEATTTHTEDGDRALDTLRARYARGELSDEEFERRRRKLQP